MCFETYNKCLTFDFIAILLNETLDEPSQTNLPSSWTKHVENPQTLNVLFFGLKIFVEKMLYAQRDNEHKFYNKLKNLAF